MRQTRYFAIALLLAVIVTACKPEKDSLDGTWLWTSTSGGIAGVYYTPESEAFDAKLVFKGGRFSFYKDGRKVTSGIYQTVCDIDELPYRRPWLMTPRYQPRPSVRQTGAGPRHPQIRYWFRPADR